MRLIESRGRRRGAGGVVVSVALHAGAIALAVVGTATAAVRTEPRESVQKLVFVAPPPEPAAPPSTAQSRAAGTSSNAPARPSVPALHIPDASLPSLELSLDRPTLVDPSASAAQSFAHAGGVTHDGAGGGTAPLGDALDANTVDRAVLPLAGATPRYPESLRAAGIDGRVVARFVVDTTGRVEPSSVTIVASTHALFTDAVRRALQLMRFRPAEARGRRVRQLAEMPFEFALGR